jgi:acetyl esterase/lipase
MVGLSQGGHATLSAARSWPGYAPELDIRGFAVAGPANVFLEQWAAGVGVAGPHLVYHALLTYAWARHYGHDGGTLWADGLAPSVDDVMLTRCTYSADGGTVGDAVGEDPSAIFSAPYLAAFQAGTLDGFPALAHGFAENRVKPFSQRVPLRIYQGDADDTVLKSGTDVLVETLRDGGVDVDYVVVPGGHHTDVAFSFLAYPQLRDDEAIAWLRDVLNR